MLVKSGLFFLLSFSFYACTKPSTSAEPVLKSAPKIATKQAQTKEDVLKEANEDYEAVLKGKLPIHAVFDENRPILGDGGTLFYIAPGYKLTVQKKLDQQEGKSGYLYGPIIEFKEILENGKPKELKSIKFYEGEALESILEHGRPKADN